MSDVVIHICPFVHVAALMTSEHPWARGAWRTKKKHTHMIPMASPGVSPYFTIIALLFPAADTSLPRGTGLSMSVCRDRKICCPRLGFTQRKVFIAAGQRKRFGSGVLGGFFGERWMDSEPPLAEGICILKMGPSRSRFVPRKNKH